MNPRKRRTTPRQTRWTIVYHGCGLVLAALFIAPIAWAALASFRPASQSGQPPLPPWPTSGLSFDNYAALEAFGSGILHYTSNSLSVSIGTVLLTVTISLSAGYGFSRFRFPFKEALFVLIMTTIMIPFQSILTPLFVMLSRIGLQNSHLGLVIVYTTLQLPFSVFMMRNAFDAVPRDIEEAARIDGSSTATILLRVMLPLVLPGIITVAIFAFLNSWNEFLAALVLLTGDDRYTLPVMMTAVRSGRMGSIDWGALQAGVTLMMLPCLVIFLLLQRFYIRGLTSGSVK